VTLPNATTVERVAASDGVALAVYEWGDPDGPEILLIHGQAQCYLAFGRQIDSDLARAHRLVAFDLRGHGASAKPLDPVHYQDGRRWADDVAAVIAAKRLRRPVLVGWSLGGRVIRQYLMHHGDRRLSGINFVGSRPIEDARVVGPASRAAIEAPRRNLGERIAADIAFLRACFQRQPDPDAFAVAVAYNMLLPPEVRDAIAGWSTDPAATVAALRKVTVPTLITHGTADRLVLPAAAEMTAEAVGGARISWYENCGHSPFFEDAPRFNRELAAFVADSWQRDPAPAEP
jgi:non-heme chloroperoxidase